MLQYKSYFTVPLSITETLAAKSLTGFSSGLNSTNLTSTLTSPLTEGVTVFVPSNEAIAAAGGSASFNLATHIIPNFLGLTPNLKNGLVLRTQAGTTLTVRVVKGEIFLGTARIQANDLVTSNGAVQVIDRVRFSS